MNDVERELRELLERKAGSVGGVAPRLPETVRKRGRRRQAGTAAVSAFTVAAVALVSFAGLRAIDRGEVDGRVPADDPWAGYEVFERTATIENFTITSPSDWYLVNQWPLSRQIAVTGATVSCSGSSAPTPAAGATGGGPPPTSTDCETSSPEPVGPEVLPVLSLSNTDLGLTTSPCLSDDDLVGDTDAVMTIAFDSSYFGANFGSGDRQRWPIPFETPSADDRRSCGPGTYVYFASDDLPYVAHFAFGERVQDNERRTLIQAFESMRVKSSPDFNPPPTVQPTSGAYVIAGGENAAGPWSLELRPSTSSGSGANVDLLLVTAEGLGVGMADVTVPGERAIEQAGGDPTFGVVTKEADSVVLRQESRLSPIPAQMIPLPPSLPFDFDIFVARNEMDMPAEAVALGADGEELGRTGGSPPEEASGTSIVARDIEFDTSSIELAPNTKTLIELRNRDAGIPHTFSVYTEADQGVLLAGTGVVTGPTIAQVEIPELLAGTYYFRCDVHPETMRGEIHVAPTASLPDTVVANGVDWRLVLKITPDGARQLWFIEKGTDPYAPLPLEPLEADQLGPWQISGAGGRLLLFGAVGEDIVSVTFEPDGATAVTVDPVLLPAEGANAYGLLYDGTIEGETGAQPGGTLIAYGSDGRELDRRAVSG